jgi:hypothetical protein
MRSAAILLKDGTAAGRVAMFSKLVRGAVLLILAVMVAAWAVSLGNNQASAPAVPPAEERLYS